MKTNVDNFSFSQLQLWESSPKSYYNRYGLGEDGFDSPYLDKGRLFMIALEFGVLDDPDPLLPELIREVPKLDIFEEKIEVLLPEEFNIKVPIISYLDTSSENLEIFGEYKTGKTEWSEENVDNTDQLLFYAAVIFLKTKKIPSCFLTWVQTEESDSGDLYYTGNYWTYDRSFSLKEINNMISRIAKAIEDIATYQYSEIDIADDLTDRIIELKKERAKLDNQIKMLENEVKNQLEFSGEKYGVSSKGTYTLTTTTRYVYSDKVKEAEKNLKKLKAIERTQGAQKTLSTGSLRFKEDKID